MRVFLFSAAPVCASFLILPSSASAGEAVPSATMPETVVISASPFGQNAIDATANVAQVSRQDIIVGGGIGLGDALKNVPGVTTSGFAPGSARPIIRGLGSTRVKVTENGLGSHDASDISDDHAVPIDPLAALEVEILRGPATLRYGSQAIGGVVNAINNRIPIDLTEGTTVEGFAGISTNSIERLGGGVADLRRGNWAFHADAIARGADDYDTPDGTQLNSFSFGRGFALGGAYIADGGSAGGIGYNQYSAHYGIPTEPDSDEVSHIELDQKNYSGQFRLMAPFAGITSISGQGVYTDYKHDEVADGEGILATFKNKEWEGRLEIVHEGFGPISNGAIGFQYGNRDFQALGEASEYLLPTKTDTFAAYVFEEVRVSDSFTIQGAARIEWADEKGEIEALGPFDLDFAPASFALGAVYRPMMGNTSFFANASWTQRTPHVTELFAQGPHEATATFEIGSPGLGIEKAFSIEGGVRHQDTNDNRASFAAYRTDFSGFIYGDLTGNTVDEDGTVHFNNSGEFKQLLYAQQNAEFWGLEGLFHWHVFDAMGGRFGIDAQADYVRATFDGGGNVPRIPPMRAGGGIFYESSLLELKISALHSFEQDEIAGNETKTDGFTTLDASATIHLFEGPSGDVDLVLSGTNLTDSIQRNHVSFTKDYVVLPGRTFRLMLHVLR